MDQPLTLETAKARIRRVFIESLELNLSEESVAGTQRLDELAGFDSGAAIVFVAALEKEFDRLIEPDKLNLDFLSDVDQLAAYFHGRGE